VEVGGAELMAAPLMGGGAPAEDPFPTEDQRDEAGGWGEGWRNYLAIPLGKHARAPPAFLVPVPNCHTEFLTLTILRALFLPRAPHIQAAYSREILHLQAGQCGNQMSTKF
jgi:hypothetical protein